MKAESVDLDTTKSIKVGNSWLIIAGILFAAAVTVSVFAIVLVCRKKKCICKDDIEANIGQE